MITLLVLFQCVCVRLTFPHQLKFTRSNGKKQNLVYKFAKSLRCCRYWRNWFFFHGTAVGIMGDSWSSVFFLILSYSPRNCCNISKCCCKYYENMHRKNWPSLCLPEADSVLSKLAGEADESLLTIQCCERHAAGMRILFPAMEAAGQKSASSNAESTPKFESILTRDVQSIFQIVHNSAESGVLCESEPQSYLPYGCAGSSWCGSRSCQEV